MNELQVINDVSNPHKVIIIGKNNTFINDILSVFNVNKTDIPDNIDRLIIDERNGLSLYSDEDVIEHPIAPDMTLSIDKINAKLIGFFIFNESNAEIIDTISIIDIPHMIPIIIDRDKFCSFFREFLKLRLAPFIKKTSLFKYFYLIKIYEK